MNPDLFRWLITTNAEARATFDRMLAALEGWLVERDADEMEAADLGEFDNRARDWMRP